MTCASGTTRALCTRNKSMPLTKAKRRKLDAACATSIAIAPIPAGWTDRPDGVSFVLSRSIRTRGRSASRVAPRKEGRLSAGTSTCVESR